MTLTSSGVTIRLASDAALRRLVSGLGSAVEKLDDLRALGTTTIN